MLLSLGALFLAAVLLAGLAILAARREIVALSEWMHALSARRAEAVETVVFTAGPVELAAETANFVDRYEAHVQSRRSERSESEALARKDAERLAAVAEELRAPMAAATAAVAALGEGEGGGLTPGQGEYVGAIASANAYLEALIDDVAVLATGSFALAPTEVDAAAALNDVRRLLEGLRGRRPLEIRVECGEGVGAVTVDPKRLKQILVNLGANAVRAVERAPRAAEGGHVTLAAGREGDRVLFTVADTGPGISVQQQATVFEPLTSLGLSIAKQLAELHGGTLDFETVEGEGTTFTLALPRAGAPAARRSIP